MPTTESQSTGAARPNLVAAPGPGATNTPSGRDSWPRVLVVEDDESHVLALKIGLEREGLAVTDVRDAREVISATERTKPDVILLDVMLPGASGIDVCRELRARGIETPIIIVSARSEELDIVIGIEIGADDYVAKPYRMRELVARIGALLRRRPNHSEERPAGTVASLPEEDVIRVGDVMLDEGRHEVFVRGELVDLPLREFQLLRELLSNAGRVVIRDSILERVWGFDYEGDKRIVATIVGRLRARLEKNPDEPTHIVTIRGVGYRFNDRV